MCYYYGDQIGLRLLQQDPEKNMLQQVQKKNLLYQDQEKNLMQQMKEPRMGKDRIKKISLEYWRI